MKGAVINIISIFQVGEDKTKCFYVQAQMRTAQMLLSWMYSEDRKGVEDRGTK